MSEFERMAEICAISAYCCPDAMDNSAAEWELSYKTLAGDRPAWAQAFRKILDPKAPPVETKAKPPPYKEVSIYVALQGLDTLSGTGDISRPRREAVDKFSAALHEGDKAEPSYKAFLEPKHSEAPWALKDAARKRAADQEEPRQKQNSARASCSNTGQLAIRSPRYIIASEVACAWQKLGGLGAALAHLAHISELSATQNAAPASRFEEAQHAALAHVARAHWRSLTECGYNNAFAPNRVNFGAANRARERQLQASPSLRTDRGNADEKTSGTPANSGGDAPNKHPSRGPQAPKGQGAQTFPIT